MEETSYAKLWNPEWCAYIKELDICLGRKPGGNGIVISDSKKISKKAARIYWDKNSRAFKIKREGKTKIFVWKQSVDKAEE